METGVECGRLLRGSSDRSFVGVVEPRRIGVVGWADILEILAAGAGGSSDEGMLIWITKEHTYLAFIYSVFDRRVSGINWKLVAMLIPTVPSGEF